jgi:Ca2+/Na+ antiporter
MGNNSRKNTKTLPIREVTNLEMIEALFLLYFIAMGIQTLIEMRNQIRSLLDISE